MHRNKNAAVASQVHQPWPARARARWPAAAFAPTAAPRTTTQLRGHDHRGQLETEPVVDPGGGWFEGVASLLGAEARRLVDGRTCTKSLCSPRSSSPVWWMTWRASASASARRASSTRPSPATRAVSGFVVTSLGCQYVLCGPLGTAHGLQGRRRGRRQEGLSSRTACARVMYWRDGGARRGPVCRRLQAAARQGPRGVSAAAMKDVVIAYEPCWAIARTGSPATSPSRSTRRSATT